MQLLGKLKLKNSLNLLLFTVLLLLSVLAYYSRILLHTTGEIINGDDVQLLLFYTFTQISTYVKSGIIPFWNPDNFTGIPLLANPSSGTLFYPFNVVFLLIPVNYALSVYLIIHTFMAAFFMYWYGRLSHINRFSSLILASAFCFSGYMSANIAMGHIESVAAAAYIPIIFGSFKAVLSNFRLKYFLLCIFMLTLQILTGTHIVAMFTLELLFIYWLYSLTDGKINKHQLIIIFRKAAIFAYIVLFAVGLAGYQLLPVIQYASESVRNNGLTYDLISRGSFPDFLFKLFIFPFSQGNPFTSNPPYMYPWPNLFEYTFFIGITPLVIILIFLPLYFYRQIILKNRNNFVIFLIISLVFFVLMSMGSFTPLHRFIYDIMPLTRTFRIPARYMLIVIFLLLCLFGEALKLIHKNSLKLIIYLLVLLELIRFGNNFVFSQPPPVNSHDTYLTDLLKSHTGNYRIYTRYLSWWTGKQYLDINASSYYGIESISGYNPMILKRYNHFIELLSQTPTFDQSMSEFPLISSFSPNLNFLGVKYIVNLNNMDDIAQNNDGRFVLAASNKTLNIYENLFVKPKFLIIHKIKAYDNPATLDNDIRLNKIDLSSLIAVDKYELTKIPDMNLSAFNSSNCTAYENDSIKLLSESPNGIVMETHSQCSGFLSLANAYYPGWEMKIDGKPVNILISNVAFISAFLPSGNHVVNLYYNPIIYVYGLAVSVFTFIILIFVIFKLKQHRIIF